MQYHTDTRTHTHARRHTHLLRLASSNDGVSRTNTVPHTHSHIDTARTRVCVHLSCYYSPNCVSRTNVVPTHCNTLQHTATHCNTLQHTATHCNTLQHTAAHCNTLQHTHLQIVSAEPMQYQTRRHREIHATQPPSGDEMSNTNVVQYTHRDTKTPIQ